MRPLNILYVVPYVPNLIRVRPYNLVRSLAERGHCVTVAALYSNELERREADELRQAVFDVKAQPLSRLRSLSNALLALPSRSPLQAVYCWTPQFAQMLVDVVRSAEPRFDVIHVEHLRGANYGLHLIKELSGPGECPPVVWDSVDCISLLFRQASAQSHSLQKRLITWLELGRTEYYEGWAAGQFQHVVVTSSNDQKALAALMPAGTSISAISVLPNGVDLDYFQPDESITREPATVVLSGKMSYHANVAMALHLIQDIMPIVWARRPDAKVVIVGKDPPREVLALAQNPAVTVTGTVEDIRPYLNKATMAVTPIMYGVGIQNKVLEAMACATPVISSPQAVSALRLVPGRDILVAQEPIAFAEAVLDLLQDPPRQRQIGEAGRAYVESHHRWPTIAAQLESIYTNVAGLAGTILER
jgi:polysaccharide biosynthesis protein PslH